MQPLYKCAFIITLVVAGCGDKETGGETHWGRTYLAGCVSDAQCDSPYQCIENVCSRPCTSMDDCSLEAGAFCDDAGKCIVDERQDCTSAEEQCNDQTEGWLCDAVDVDACRATVSVCRNGLWLDGVLDICRDNISEEPDPNTIVVRRSEVIRPVDVLMVVDSSTSMAREQSLLGDAMPTFVDTLLGRGVGDLQIGTTGVDALCDVPGTPVRGRFNTTPDAVVGVVSSFSVNALCEEDADCTESACADFSCGPTTSWSCEGPMGCEETGNGSVVSRCILQCTSDADCTSSLGAGYTCLQLPERSGCVPALESCPSSVDPVLRGSNLADVACAFRVGLSTELCFDVEQPLEAMKLALDPAGPNAAQHVALVRPQAILAVVVLTDEDDCSLVGTPQLDVDAYRCSVLNASEDEGPLMPTAHYVDFIRGLKPPGRTFFATIAGDSLATDSQQRAGDRTAYLDALMSEQECNWGSSICTNSDASGTASYASRLFATVDAMAPDSRAENICADEDGFDAPIARIADQLAETATRICLPSAPPTGFTVTRIIAGVETPVVEGTGPGTWHTTSGAAECSSGIAIVLIDPPVAGESLRFAYPAP